MANEINIDKELYDSYKPFTAEIAKQIYEEYGEETLDNLLMQRLRDGIMGDVLLVNTS